MIRGKEIETRLSIIPNWSISSLGDSRNIPFMPDGGDAPYIEAPRNGSTVDMGIASVNSSSPVTVQLSVRGRNIESAVSVEVGGMIASAFR